MRPSTGNSTAIARVVLVGCCGATAGAHAALVPAHITQQGALGAAFVAAALLTLAVSAGLAVRPSSAALACLATLLLATLIVTYLLAVTTGVPWLIDDPETVDSVGVATKAVEAVGVLFGIQLITTAGGRRSLTHKGVQP